MVVSLFSKSGEFLGERDIPEDYLGYIGLAPHFVIFLNEAEFELVLNCPDT